MIVLIELNNIVSYTYNDRNLKKKCHLRFLCRLNFINNNNYQQPLQFYDSHPSYKIFEYKSFTSSGLDPGYSEVTHASNPGSIFVAATFFLPTKRVAIL